MATKSKFLPTVPATPETLLTPAQVAETLKVKEQTLAKWRCLGTGPRFVRCGGIRYRPSDIAAHINANLSPAMA